MLSPWIYPDAPKSAEETGHSHSEATVVYV